MEFFMAALGKALETATAITVGLHREFGLSIRAGAASILAGKAITTYSPTTENLASNLSFLSKIPMFGSLPYGKIATNTLSYTNFVVALSSIVKFNQKQEARPSITPAGMLIAAGSTLSGIKKVFGERAFGVSLPEGLRDLSTLLWTVGSFLQVRDIQSEVYATQRGSSLDKKEIIGNLRVQQKQNLVFAAIGVISLLGRYIAAIRSPQVQLALTVAPAAMAALGAWKGVYSPSSQLVNQIAAARS